MQHFKDIAQEYEIDFSQSLDAENFGAIYPAKEFKTGEQLAIKHSEIATEIEDGMYARRYQKAMQLKHSNLLPYRAVFQYEEEGMTSTWGLMTLSSGNNLQQCRGLLSLEQREILVNSVMDTLEFLHGQQTLWQCLNEEHILVESQDVLRLRCINYGNKQKMHLDYFADYSFLAPEQLSEEGEVDERTDIWALGVLIYLLFAERLPFGELTASLSNNKIRERILGDWPLGLLKRIPQPYRAITERCLCRDKEERWSSVEELQEFMEKWIPAPEVEEVTEASAPEISEQSKTPRRQFKRKPSKPINWWFVLFALFVAGLLGHYLSTLV